MAVHRLGLRTLLSTRVTAEAEQLWVPWPGGGTRGAPALAFAPPRQSPRQGPSGAPLARGLEHPRRQSGLTPELRAETLEIAKTIR